MDLPIAQAKRVVVIAGPTGSGESTVTNALIQQFPESFKRLVTATTRSPRGNEQNGIDYHFFSKDQFLAHKEQGEMLETTYVANRDIYYGTYAPDLRAKLDAGFIAIINPDIVGARFYKENYAATTIFIAPPDLETLRSRLQRRNPDITNKEIDLRLDNARNEMENERSFYDYTVVNEDGGLEKAVTQVIDILRGEEYVF